MLLLTKCLDEVRKTNNRNQGIRIQHEDQEYPRRKLERQRWIADDDKYGPDKWRGGAPLAVLLLAVPVIRELPHLIRNHDKDSKQKQSAAEKVSQ